MPPSATRTSTASSCPDGIDALSAAAIGCRYMTAFHAVTRQRLLAVGQWVAVHGAGGIGLSAVQIAAALGGRVIAVDLDEAKLEKATAEGARHAVNAGTQDVAEAIKQLTGGGADLGDRRHRGGRARRVGGAVAAQRRQAGAGRPDQPGRAGLCRDPARPHHRGRDRDRREPREPARGLPAAARAGGDRGAAARQDRRPDACRWSRPARYWTRWTPTRRSDSPSSPDSDQHWRSRRGGEQHDQAHVQRAAH